MPCVDLPYKSYPELRDQECFWRGDRIRILLGLTYYSSDIRPMGVVQDGRIALLRLRDSNVIPVWFWDNATGVTAVGHNYCERFPPSWSKLAVVSMDGVTFYNRDHKWTRIVAERNKRLELSTPKEYADALVPASRSKIDAIEYIFHLATHQGERIYSVLAENHPDDLRKVISLAGIGDEAVLYGWDVNQVGAAPSGVNKMWIFNKGGFATRDSPSVPNGLQFSDGMTLPFPEDTWWVTCKPQA